jgi:GT2 family glycosyltransferase
MRATIIVASLNEGDCLWRTLQSCVASDPGPDCEILVVDDHSDDGSIEEAHERFPHVRFVAQERRRGVAATKDLGARAASGEVLVFLDAHCKPERGAIARLVDDVEELDGRAIVTPAVPVLSTEAWENQFVSVGNGYWVDLRDFSTGWADTSTLRRVGRFYETQALIGCALAIGRTLYSELAGFDTGMQLWGSEDVDLGLKAWFMGARILNDPEAVVGHRFQVSFSNYQLTAVEPAVNQLRMARKHLGHALWEDWLWDFRRRCPAGSEFWERVWKGFNEGRETLDRERAYLSDHRTRDEYWFAEYFNLLWPPSRLIS